MSHLIYDEVCYMSFCMQLYNNHDICYLYFLLELHDDVLKHNEPADF